MTAEYPFDLFTSFSKAKGQIKTFSIEPYLYPFNATEGDKPYQLYNKFSRFKFTLINNSTTPKTFINCNVDLKSIPDMLERTRFAYHKAMEEETGSAVQSSQDGALNSPAYTVPLKGKFNNKTAAQYIVETGDVTALMNQRNYLTGSNYRDAQAQIAAIDDAMNLMNSGMLKAPEKTAGMTGKFEIYSSGMKPLVRKKRSDGMCPVNELRISWVYGFKSPVEIDEVTYYAPVKVFPNGTMNVVASGKDTASMKRETFHMTAGDWLDALARMQRVMRQFEVLQAKNMFDTIQSLQDAARAKAQAEQPAYQQDYGQQEGYTGYSQPVQQSAVWQSNDQQPVGQLQYVDQAYTQQDMQNSGYTAASNTQYFSYSR